jgi:NDP-sugar pyrophosphorylase family protein
MPIAGLGSRFTTAGITKPKPLITIGDKPMVRWAADSIPFVDDQEFVFVVREAHVDKYDIDEKLRDLFSPDVDIVVIDYLTEGPACTAELAGEYVNDEESVIVTDSDHYFRSEAYDQLLTDPPEDVSGAIPVFQATDEGLSYSAVNDDMRITRVAEKERISQYANIGAYYFGEFGDFRWALERTREKERTVNEEYYVAPLYNELIERGDDVLARNCDTVWSLGTPDAVETFEEEYLNPRSEY